MCVIYRSPNLPLETYRGAAEFHVVVRHRKGERPTTNYQFRSLVPTPRKWQPLCQWADKKPKGLHRIFAPYRRSVRVALANVR